MDPMGLDASGDEYKPGDAVLEEPESARDF